MISLIAALSSNRVIGKDNKLPWHIPADLKRFKEITTGHPVIMGRKTFESIGRALPGRVNIVVSSDKSRVYPDTIVATSLEEAITIAKDNDPKEIFIIGGEQVFNQSIGIADRLYLTLVHKTVEGDTFFPDYSKFSNELFHTDHESNDYKYSFVVLEK